MRALIWGGLSCWFLWACESDTRPAPYQPPDRTGGEGGEPGEPPIDDCEKPPEIDTSSACGAETVRLFERKPSIYFVLDTSGSMAGTVLRGSDPKIDAAKTALKAVAEEIGHRVKFGLTTFPAPDDDYNLDPNAPLPLLGCAAGQEVFSVQAGDPIVCLNKQPNGPVLRAFRREVDALSPAGGTPLSPTLLTLAPTVLGLEGLTSVILVTDGSPNCNPDAECDAAGCGLNQAGNSIDGVMCDEDFNCCDEQNSGDIFENPRGYCIDDSASVSAVELLARAGVSTYVIGVLGEEDFDDTMNALAVAGGKPRSGERAYYDVESLDELTDAVRAIGSEIAQRCQLELIDRPSYANELNVFFDGVVVPLDKTDGWTLEEDIVTLHGEACSTLQAGQVSEVALISGCETIIR